MASKWLTAAVISATAALTVPQYGFARPDAHGDSTAAQLDANPTASLQLPVDPIITGRRGPTVADAGWTERAAPRHRCSFCSGYQPFPQE